MRAASAVALAGGRSRRFGADKALAQFRGAPLLAHSLRGLCALEFEQVLVSAKEPSRYAAVASEISHITGRTIELVADERAAETPLAGLAAALKAARHPLVFAIAADMPFAAEGALVDALFAALGTSDAVLPFAGGSLQPLCALWRREACLAAAEELLALANPPGPRAVAQRLRAVQLGWPDPRPFLDADTPSALADLDRS